MILLEGDYGGVVVLIFGVMFGPPIVFAIIGLLLLIKKHKTAAKVFFILAVIYLIISLGVCGSMMM